MPGAIGLVSQSGAFGGLAYMLARSRGHSLSYMFTTGNEADVDIGDCTAFLADDPDTKAILLYMEGCRNGPKFLAALERARASETPVVAVKLGRTEAGAAAAASHTAALAGEDAVYDSLFRQFGVYRADSIEEFFDIARSCVVGTLPANERVAMVTVSGGVGVLMADDANRRGLEVAPMPEAAQRRMLELVPFAAARNPIDVTGQVLNDPTLLDQAIELAATNGDYGSVVSFQGSIGRNPALMEATRGAWIERKAANPETHFAVSGFCTEDYTRDLEAAGIPVYEEATHATRAIAALAGFARSFRERRARPAVPAPADLPAGPLNELAALNIVAPPACRPCPPASREPPAKRRMRPRTSASPSSSRCCRRTSCTRATSGAFASASPIAPPPRPPSTRSSPPPAPPSRTRTIDGCLVAPMVTGGVETILGVQRDPVFGPIVMFGLGGIFVEALKDVTFRAAPFDEAEARAMIESVAAYPLLTGLRGQPPADLDALAAALSRLSLFAAANAAAIESLDLNPFLVRPSGALALDAVLVTRPPTS